MSQIDFSVKESKLKNNILIFTCNPNSILNTIYILLIISINIYFIRIPVYLTESTEMLNNQASRKQETGLLWELHIMNSGTLKIIESQLFESTT